MAEPEYEPTEEDQIAQGENIDDAQELRAVDTIMGSGSSPAGGVGSIMGGGIDGNPLAQSERVIKALTDVAPDLKDLISPTFNLSNLTDDDIEYLQDGVEVYLHWKSAFGKDSILVKKTKYRIYAFLELKRSSGDRRERVLLSTQILSLFRGGGRRSGGSPMLNFGKP